MNKRTLIAVAIAYSLSTSVCFANNENELEIIEIISDSRRAESLVDSNSSVVVMDEEELKLISASHIQQALNRLPSVNISRNNGQESLISIRSPIYTGPGACGSFLVAEQGIPVRAAGFCNVNELFDTHTENAQRVEVGRGPSSVFFGANAVHGMINVVLPSPQETTSITVEAGTLGYKRLSFAKGTEHKDFKQILLFTGVDDQGWRDDNRVKQQKLSWLYQYNINDNFSLDGGLTITNLAQETAGYVVGKNAYQDNDLRTNNLNTEAYRDNKSQRFWTTLITDVNNWQLRLTPYYRSVDMSFLQHFLPGTPIEDSSHTSYGIQSAVYKSFDNNSSLAFGVDFESTNGSLYQYQQHETESSSAFLVNVLPQGIHYDYQVKAKQSALFTNYQQNWSTGWALSLGLRYENIHYNYDNQATDGRLKQDGTACGFDGCRYARPADRKDDFSNLSPKLALSYQFNEQHKIQLRARQGYRAPQATELYRLQNTQLVAELDSVELDSFELSYTAQNNQWLYSASVYYMDKKNDITTDSSRAKVGGVNTLHKGIEVMFEHQLGDATAVKGVYNFAYHTYNNELFSGGDNLIGNDIDSAPNQFGNITFKWFPNEKLLTELEWVHMGEYFTNPENTHSYQGHDTLNFRVRYSINPQFTIALNMLNITDKAYAERADWTTFTGDRYFPGKPVRAFLSLHWQY